MILDTLEHGARYYALGKRFEQSLRWLQKTDLGRLPAGKTSIEGEDIYISISDYQTKEQGRWEAHRVYADIQVVLGAHEIIGWTPLQGLDIDTPYDSQTDLLFCKGNLQQGTPLLLKPGLFVIFYPSDAHMPMLTHTQPQTLRKGVVKVRLA